MIHHLCAAYTPISHCPARRTAEVTWWQSSLSLSLSVSPSILLPCPSLCLALHTTSLYTPFLPPPDHHFRSLRFHLSFLLSPTAPFSSEHCFKPQRIICAIHSFHLSLFLCARLHHQLRRLTRTLSDIKSPYHNTSTHSDPGAQVRSEYSFSRFSNHTVLASWHLLNPSTLHAACRLTMHMLYPCNQRVTSALLTNCNPSGL